LVEIGEALSIRSTNGVHKLVKTLEAKGYITRTPRVSRGIALAETSTALSADSHPLLPVVSRVRSDQPDRLRAHPVASLLVDPRLLGRVQEDACVIAVSGDDGMEEQGIRRGDFLVVEETDWQQLLNGELAAVLIGEGIIARYFEFTRNRLHLRPSARGYEKESFHPNSPGCHIIGRVLSVMRKL
ncbi:MAG: S24 family peptidase, partial [Woeseia sp.]